MESQRKRKQKDKSNGIGAHKDNAKKKTKTKLKIRTMILHYEAYLINDKQKRAACPSNPSIRLPISQSTVYVHGGSIFKTIYYNNILYTVNVCFR